jgi:cAMP-dependent protein kinase regulator
MRSRRPSIDRLDRYLVKGQYDRALEAVTGELARNPNQFNLLLRKADILDRSGNRDRALALYERLAQRQAREGYFGRSIALYKKILRIAPERDDVHAELARLIEEDVASRLPFDERMRRQKVVSPPRPGTEHRRSETSHPEGAPQPEEREEATLFSAFPPEALKKILTSTYLRSYEQGDIIVTEGERGSSLFLIVAGEVKVFTKGTAEEHVPLAELGPGDFFGEVSLLTGKPRTATITASTPVTAIELDKQDVDRIAVDHPEVSDVLRAFYERRAQSTVEAIMARIRENQ